MPVGAITNPASLSDILGCKVGTFTMMYLGLPLGATFKASHIWKLEPYCRKVGKMTCEVEEVVSIQRWNSDLNQEYVIFHSYLLYVTVYYAYSCG